MERYSTVYCDGTSVIVQFWSHKPKYDADNWIFYHPAHFPKSYDSTSHDVLSENFELNTELNRLVNEAFRNFSKQGYGIEDFNIMVLSDFITTKTKLKSVIVAFREFLESKGLIEREIEVTKVTKPAEIKLEDLAQSLKQKLSFREVVEAIKQGHPFTCNAWAGIGVVEFNPCSLRVDNNFDVNVHFPSIVRNLTQSELVEYMHEVKPSLCYIDNVEDCYLEEAEEKIYEILGEYIKLKYLNSKEFKDLFSRIMKELPLGSRESFNVFRTFYHLQFLYQE